VIESRSYTAFGDELTSSGTGARTSYIGRETDNESDLGFYGVRLYDPTYGRFLSTDPLWSKYLPLQSYQYAGNSPVMFLDYSGKHIVGKRAEDRAYLATSMKSHFNVDVTFTDQSTMVISAEQLEYAKTVNDPESFAQLESINEMAMDPTKILNIAAIAGSSEVQQNVSVGGTDPNGNHSSQIVTGVVTGPGASEAFLSHADRPNNAWVIIRPSIANGETFSAAGGQQTKPCGTCVLVHALLDHALPWFKAGASQSRKEGVKNHNSALVNKANSVPRDGKDHTDDGSQK
jgi:RHS repeat-associated protein